MSITRTKENTFSVGICMAGAVSAGAYTAGVMDYLLEALGEWEKRREQTGVPTHHVELPIIGGASAGGMTAVITAAALRRDLHHVEEPTSPITADIESNKLYHSWVDMTGPDMLTQMLDCSDIKSKEVYSALNSQCIDALADRAISNDPGDPVSLPAYLSPDLKIFTTLSNLEGFSFDVKFNSGDSEGAEYYMQLHNDYACFQLTDQAISGDNEGWIPLNFDDAQNGNIELAKKAGMATGAFPVGLKSRKVVRDPKYINALDWLKDVTSNTPVEANCQPIDGKLTMYESLNIDGGMINNEPFDRVRDYLDCKTGQDDPKDYENYDNFKSTILMIAPFPSTSPEPIDQNQNLPNVIALTLSAMISQMRARPMHVKNAFDINCAGQYVISPSRKMKKGDADSEAMVGDKAIACGAMGGFSGFINKEFRVHDFFLGRYNCYIFLRDYFTIPASALTQNPIFREGYHGINIAQFESKNPKMKGQYQIIPIFQQMDWPKMKFRSGSDWPAIPEEDIKSFIPAIGDRAQTMAMNVIEWKWSLKLAAQLVFSLGGRSWVGNQVTDYILKALLQWKLIKG